MQSFIFHYIYHPLFFHFLSRKERDNIGQAEEKSYWAWQEEKGVRRGKHCLNNEIAKDAFGAEFRKVEFPCVSSLRTYWNFPVQLYNIVYNCIRP